MPTVTMVAGSLGTNGRHAFLQRCCNGINNFTADSTKARTFTGDDQNDTSYYLLPAMPDNLDTITSITFKTITNKQKNGGNVLFQLVESDESTAITDEVAVGPATTITTNEDTWSITGDASKAKMDSARLKMRFTSGDGSDDVRVFEFQMTITYTSTYSSPETWLDDDWDYRVPVEIHKERVPSTQSDIPIHLDLSTLPAEFFTNVDSAGADIRVTKSDGTTQVPVEVVDIDTGASTGEIYFKGDASSSSDTMFFVYYGNSGASAPAADATYGSQNVWTDYNLVMHLNESVNNDVDGYTDSTGNGNDGTGNSMALTPGSGILGGVATSFDGAADYIKITNHASLSNTKAFTVTAWAKRESDVGFCGFVSKTTVASNGWNLNFRDGTGNDRPTALTNIHGYIDNTIAEDSTNFDWMLVGLRSDSMGSGLAFVNGSGYQDSTASGDITDIGADIDLGRFYVDNATASLYGHQLLDEVRYYDGVLSHERMLFDYNNQANNELFFIAGSGEANNGQAGATPVSTTNNVFIMLLGNK